MAGRKTITDLMHDADQAPPPRIFAANAGTAVNPASRVKAPPATSEASSGAAPDSSSSPPTTLGSPRRPRPTVLRRDRNPISATTSTTGQLDQEVRERWRWQLGATARKARAAQRKAAQSTAAWERLVAEARVAGVPELLLLAAAADAELELPEV